MSAAPELRRQPPGRHGRLLHAPGAGTAALVLVALAACGAPPSPATDALRTTSPPAADSGVRDFTDSQRWPSLPALPTDGLLTIDEVTTALPAGGPWGTATADWVSPPWRLPWCDDGGGPLRRLTAAPPPRDEHDALLVGAGYPGTSGSSVSVAAVRWEPTSEGAEAAQRWAAALRAHAAGCPGAAVLDPAGVPGEEPLLTATPQGSGSWRVQAVTTGGPTVLRFDVGLTAAGAEEAGAVVASLVTTAVGRLASADDLAGHLSDRPASRPELTAQHVTGSPDLAAPAGREEMTAAWCPGAGALDVGLPEQAWAAPERVLLRFTGVGDEAGVAAAQAYSAALRAGAQRCVDAERGRTVLADLGETGPAPWHGSDVLLTAVEQADGSWAVTGTARDGVTVLVVRTRVTTRPEWVDGAALGLLGEAWVRVHDGDRAPGATASLP